MLQVNLIILDQLSFRKRIYYKYFTKASIKVEYCNKTNTLNIIRKTTRKNDNLYYVGELQEIKNIITDIIDLELAAIKADIILNPKKYNNLAKT